MRRRWPNGATSGKAYVCWVVQGRARALLLLLLMSLPPPPLLPAVANCQRLLNTMPCHAPCRQRRVFSIDPPTARDLDDALSGEPVQLFDCPVNAVLGCAEGRPNT